MCKRVVCTRDESPPPPVNLAVRSVDGLWRSPEVVVGWWSDCPTLLLYMRPASQTQSHITGQTSVYAPFSLGISILFPFFRRVCKFG